MFVPLQLQKSATTGNPIIHPPIKISIMKRKLFFAALLTLSSTALLAQSYPKHSDITDALESNTTTTTYKKGIKLPKDEPPPYVISGDMAYELRREKASKSSSSSEIFAENLENIYPGAVVYADESLADGDPTLVGLAYGTVTVRVDFNTGKSSSKSGVKNSPEAIQKAIHDILNSMDKAYYPPVSYDYKTSYASSIEELAADMGVSVNFLSASAKITASTKSKKVTVTKVEDYTQTYYTVSITQESDKSKYFGEKVTGNDVAKKMKKAPLAIITSVTYGRRAYHIKEYSSSNFKVNAKEDANAYGQKAFSTQDITKKSKVSNERLWVSGSDATSSGASLGKQSSIRDAIAKNLKFDPATSQGAPLYYVVRYLSTGKTATIKTTDEYWLTEYVPMLRTVNVTLHNNCTHVAGAACKVRLDYNVVKFNKKGEKVRVKRRANVVKKKEIWPMDGYVRFWESEIGFDDHKTFILDIAEGEFLDGPIHLQIRCKKTSNGDWDNDVEEKIYPVDGGIELFIHGAIRPGGKKAYIHSKSEGKYVKVKD